MPRVSISEYWIKRGTKYIYQLTNINLSTGKFTLIPVDNKSLSIETITSDKLNRNFKVCFDDNFSKFFNIDVTIKHNVITAIEYLLSSGKHDCEDSDKIKCLKKAKEYINEELQNYK